MQPLLTLVYTATLGLSLLLLSGCDADNSAAPAEINESLNSLNSFPFKAHDPSRLIEIAPNKLAFLTSTDANDPAQDTALKMYVIDTDSSTAQWESWGDWPFGEVISNLDVWHLPWMMAYGYSPEQDYDYHRELALVAPSFYRPDIIYFSLWNEAGADVAAAQGAEGAMYRAIYRTVAEGTWPNQQWTMEPYPVYYSDMGTFNAGMPRGLDAHVWDNQQGQLYMTFGSWDPEGHAVIQIAEMDAATGRIAGVAPNEAGYWGNTADRLHPVATFGEAAYSYQRSGWYYLFLNLGTCCDGINSTYQIVVGRSRSVFGPYLDEQGRSFIDEYDYGVANFPGKRVLAAKEQVIGPGHTGIYEHPDGRLSLSFHYYDGNSDGVPRFGLRELYFNDEGWPVVVDN